MAVIDSPLVYPGGKHSIRNFICENMPPHHTWVDVFGGGASISLYKPKSEVEIYNDAGFVSLFFAVMRDEEAGPELHRRLQFTPMSEDEFNYCRVHWKYETDIIEQMRMWYVQILQCFTHEEEGSGWIGVGKKVSMARSFRNHVEAFPEVVARFRDFQITHRHFRDVIKLFDDPETLFYCDPPYLNTEGGDVEVGYMQAMTLSEHKELLNLLKKCKGQVMLSGYNNPLYEKELEGWEHRTLTRMGMIKNGSQLDSVTERTEYLWCKRNHNIQEKKPKSRPKVVSNEEELLTLWSSSDFS